jgi:hypothetical protein
MRLTSGGNLLVGTTTDSGYKLDVNGIGRFSGGYQTPVAIFERNADYGQVITLGRKGVSSLAGIGYPADGVISFLTSNTERARIDSNGNLGLGTTSPETNMQIVGSTFSIIRVTSTGSNVAGIDFGNTSNSDDGRIRFTPSGSMEFFTNDQTRLNLNSAGNLGLGVTPSAWSAGKAFEISSNGNSVWSYGQDNIYLLANSYFNGGWKYGGTGYATNYTQYQGQHQWHNAPSGTAGTAISFTQAMTLNASGNLLIGNTASVHASSGRGVVEINGASTSILGLTINGAAAGYLYHGGTNLSVWNVLNGSMEFGTNNTTRLTITSGGNVLIGTTTDSGYKLQVNGNIQATGFYESSDKRLKDILFNKDSENFGAISFNWKDKRDSKLHWGYVAQEVEKFLPDAIIKGNDGFLSIDYNQAHTFKIAMIEDEVTILKRRVKELETQLNLG